MDNNIWAGQTAGLCNNNDGASDLGSYQSRGDDYTTDNLLDFLKSWSEDPMCGEPTPTNNYCVSFMISMSAWFTKA